MHITSIPETRTVTYRYIDVIFPSRVLSYTLTADDWLEQDESSIRIKFKDGTNTEILLQNALVIETKTVTREEIVKSVEH